MKIILRYILKNIGERKLRTAVMLLSIVLSATLLFISMSIGDSYESAQQKMAKGSAGSAIISVSAKADANGNMVWIRQNEIPKLDSIKNQVGILTVPALYSQNNYYENFDLIAANLNELNAVNKPRLADNKELKDFAGNSIVLPEKFTSKFGLKPGDTIVLSIGEVRYDFKLSAIAAYDTVFLRETRGFNALVPQEALSEILQASGNSKILIEPAAGVNVDDLKSQLSSALPQERYNVSEVYDEAQVKAAAQQKSLPFYLISFFSLTMSVFIIYSSYKVITLERLPAIGTFRSIGATQRATTKMLLLESLVYGILGGLISIPLGFGVLKLILMGMGDTMQIGIEIPMVVSPLNIALACIVAVVVSLVSAYAPIRRASKLSVKDVVLGAVEEKAVSNKAKLWFGAAVFVASVILPRIVGRDNDNLLLLACGVSLIGLIAGTIIIIPLITNALSGVFERFYGAILGNEGKLAARNIRQNKNITQNISLLFISLSAVIVITVITGFLTSYIIDVYAGGKLDGFASGEMNVGFVEKVKNIEGVEEVVPIYDLDNSISSGNAAFTRMEAVDDIGLLSSMLSIQYDNAETKNSIAAAFGSNRNILLSKDCLKQLKLNVGDTISLKDNGREYGYTIIGSFKSRGDTSEAIIPAGYARSDFGADNYGMLAFTAADPDAAMAQIRNLFGNKYNWSRTVAEFTKDAQGVIGAFTEPMNKLAYFILLLAAIGVINNLIINYIQKKHAIAMYKSVGLSNRQNVKMTVIEGFTSGLIGVGVTLIVSYLEIQTVFIATGSRIAVDPTYDAGIFVLAGIAGIAITLIGSVVPILKGSKMKLVEEIKFE